MATPSNSLLLDPQLHSFARAYMWQLLRQGKFAEPATEPLHVLAQELAQAIAALPGDRDQKGRLLSTIAQYLSGGDLSVPPPAEVQALLRPLLSPEEAPGQAATSPAPEGPAAPDATVPAPAAAEPGPSQPAVAEPVPVSAELAAPAAPEAATAAPTASDENAAVAESAALALDPNAVASGASDSAAAPAASDSASAPGASDSTAAPAASDSAAAPAPAAVSEDATAAFAAQNPPPAYHPVPAAESAVEAASDPAGHEFPPAGPAQVEGSPGVSTEVKSSGSRRSRRS